MQGGGAGRKQQEEGLWEEVACHVAAEKREGHEDDEEMHLSTTS